MLVIDGQQRLTTMTILLRALFNSLNEKQETTQRALERVNECLLYRGDVFDGENFVKIEHSKVDRKYYQDVIKNEINFETIESKSCESNVLRCYKYYIERIKSIFFKVVHDFLIRKLSFQQVQTRL